MSNIRVNEAIGDGVPAGLTYHQMVKDLFKVDLPGNEAPFMHAAIGISGEVAEIITAETMGNLREECGDLEFYLEAAWQAVSKRHFPVFHGMPIGQAHHELVLSAGEILDTAKKSWVYGKPIDKLRAVDWLQSLEESLIALYAALDIRRGQIQYENMVKLVGKSGRYREGTYSDAAAVARADKGEPQ